MLDGGSEFSIIDQSLAKKLGVETRKEGMTVTTLDSTTWNERQVCHLTLSNMEQTLVLESSKLVINESLPTSTCSLPQNSGLSKFGHLKGVQVIELPKWKKITLIIGTNEPSAHVSSEARRGSRFEPQALRTPFGWTIVSTGSSNSQCASMQKDEKIRNKGKVKSLPVFTVKKAKQGLEHDPTVNVKCKPKGIKTAKRQVHVSSYSSTPTRAIDQSEIENKDSVLKEKEKSTVRGNAGKLGLPIHLAKFSAPLIVCTVVHVRILASGIFYGAGKLGELPNWASRDIILPRRK
jgi:hypothetical protein